MKRNSFFCLAAIMAGCISQVSAQTTENLPDSVNSVKTEKVESLHEVVVEAATKKVIKQGIAFFPTKREKEFATDGVNLIQMMALTELPYDYRKNVVTDAAGSKVNYFIDGREASPKELLAMNPQDVVRVEYLPMPTSGKFHGKRNVVNYVMKKYETGGFTRLKALQDMRGRQGDYSLSTRMAYKEMAFDAFFEGDYKNSVNTGSVTDNVFKEITYQNNFYENLRQTVDNSRNRQKQNEMEGYFKAIWNHKAISLTAMAGWNRMCQPEEENISETVYTPEVIDSDYTETTAASLSINPYAKVNMNLDLPHSQSLSVILSGFYQAEKASSNYDPLNLPPIFNATKDKSWNGMASVSWSKELNDHNSLDINGYITQKRNNTDYTGSFEGRNDYRDFKTNLSATFSHTFRPGTFLSISAGADRTAQKINGIKMDVQWNPEVSLSFSHKWNAKSDFRLSTNTFTIGYAGDAMNDVIIRTSELMWRKGNPFLKNRLWWQSMISNTWNFSPKFSITLRGVYTRVFHQDTEMWDVVAGYDGLVNTLTSDNTADKLVGGLRTTLKLFDKRLVINGNIEYSYFHLTGDNHRSKGYAEGSLSATWYGKGWYAGGVFIPAATLPYMYGIAEIYDNWKYYFNIGFSKVKNLNLRLQIANPFGEKWTSITRVNTEHFSRRTQAYSCFASNRFTLTAIYTISYGKKVAKVNMSKQGQIDSGAMKAE
ncbi:MAG: outer membrane beta-barrel family protein [Muribaculaceae bacterium]|nr:outer membrane beta-barrel family protein [Muribaculaceae bacterium]